MVKELFLGEDRGATKAYLKLFIEKIVINLPRIDITCKSAYYWPRWKTKRL